MATILCVDDEPDCVMLMKAYLEKCSHTVFKAHSGREALDILKLKKNEIDLLITDIRMPGMDGIELIGKALSVKNNLQAIVVTGFGEMETAVEAMQKGADNYLRKPLDLEELLVAVDKCMEKMELIRRLEKTTKRELELALEAKEAAEAANTAKAQFLGSMSHELKTPLNHIIGFTELVLDQNLGDLNDLQQEYLNDVLYSSKHLLELINDILDLSKVEAGRLELEYTDVDLQKFLEKSLAAVEKKAAERGLQLELDTKEIPESIRGDERKLEKIIGHLLSNALKFTPAGGSICLRANRARGSAWCDAGAPRCESEDFIEISVQDTGIGIKQEDQKRIFNPFEQVDGSASRKYQGAGLGLVIAKRFVELQGGAIRVTSSGEGQGSVFSLVVPG